MTQKQERKQRGPSWKTILCILGAAALWLGFRGMLNINGAKSGAYDSYAGPVLPMTVVEGGENVQAERHVDFDFSPYADYQPGSFGGGEIAVTDSYRLTNPTDETLHLKLAYPYEGKLIEEQKYTPAITVDGVEAKAEPYASVDEGERIFGANDFWEYKALMTETDYLRQAVAEEPPLQIPVKAYHFTDITYQGDQEYPYIFLILNFSIPEGAGVWVRHFDVLHSDHQARTYSLWFQDDLEEKDMAYLFIVGGDVENLTFGGNLGHNVTDNSALTDVTCEYEVYDTTFDDLIWEMAQDYRFWGEDENPSDPRLHSPELLYRDAMKRMEEHVSQDDNSITGAPVSVVGEYFNESMVTSRLLYWVFEVEIPAGEAVQVEAAYCKKASTDISGPKKDRDGYDLATTLGSNLRFTAQTAGITGGEYIEILRQNFGFNLRKAITQVRLAPETERYYLDVCKKSA